MTVARRLTPAVAAALVLAAPAAAGAQDLPPSLTVDTGYAFSGVSDFDFTPGAGVSPDDASGAAADPARDRLYAVGTTAAGAGTAIAVVARTSSGALDPAFAGDGSLTLPVTAPGSARGADMVVLPDGRLRIAGTVDRGTAGLPDLDVVLVGLLPDGSPDPAFGTDGVLSFPIGAAGTADVASRLDVDAAGRLAVTGATGTDATQASFVAVREADGSAASFGTGGTTIIDHAAGAPDRGADVAWGPAGPLVLIATGTAAAPDGAFIHALTPTGAPDAGFSDDGDMALPTGGTASTAGGLVLAAGRVWATGSSVVAGDTDAYLVRAGLDGSGAELRRFDMRGATFAAAQQVASAGTDLTLVPGDPETLVVGGSTATDRGTEVAAAAFNGLGGPVAALQATDVVVNVEGQASTVGVAPSGPGVALSAALRDFSLETGSGSNDTSIGMSRLLVDAEKRCDLRLTIASPLELLVRGRSGTAVTLQASNVGQRPCGGTITAAPPFVLAGQPVLTGRLAPGGSVSLPVTAGYLATQLPARAQLSVGLAAAADAATGDNVATVGARFSFCDLRVRRFSGPRSLSTEGTTTLGFSVRNVGTAACRTPGITVGVPGVRTDKHRAYTVPAGQSVTEEVTVRLARRARSGRLTVAYTVPASADVLPDSNAVRVVGAAVRPGDTDVRRPRGDRDFSGRARAGRATGVSRRQLRVKRVQLALRFLPTTRRNGRTRRKADCRWLSSPRGATVRLAPGAKRRCDRPVWLNAKGSSRWKLRLGRRLPAGRYVVRTRAVLVNGITESSVSRRDGNERTFTVRRRTRKGR